MSLILKNRVNVSKRSVVCKATPANKGITLPKFADVIDKRKEIDRMRWDKVKEIGNTLDHIAKSEAKQTYEIINEILPVERIYKECTEIVKKCKASTKQ